MHMYMFVIIIKFRAQEYEYSIMCAGTLESGGIAIAWL